MQSLPDYGSPLWSLPSAEEIISLYSPIHESPNDKQKA